MSKPNLPLSKDLHVIHGEVPEFFYEIRDFVLQHTIPKKYKNKFRVCVLYDIIITLDATADLKEHFGISVREPDSSAALASFCYDVLNEVILDASLGHNETSEYDIVKSHIAAINKLSLQNNAEKGETIYIFPRQYLSQALFAELIDRNIYFIMHMQKIFKTGVKRTENEETVTFIHDDKECTATAFTITLRSGEKETFVTNLEKQYLNPQQLGELYFKQWNVSLKLRLLDGQLQHEYITGQTTGEVYIDFWRRTAIANAIEPTKDARKRAIEAEKRARGKHFRQDRNSKDLMESLTERYNEIINDEKRNENGDPIQQLINEFMIPDDEKEDSSKRKNRRRK